LVGNKCDLDAERQVNVDEGAAFAKQHGLHAFVETSAKTAHNVSDAFLAAAGEIYARYKRGELRSVSGTSGLANERGARDGGPGQKGTGCCD